MAGTYPPHMLPLGATGALVVVCLGLNSCPGNLVGCPWCAVIDPATDDPDAVIAAARRCCDMPCAPCGPGYAWGTRAMCR